MYNSNFLFKLCLLYIVSLTPFCSGCLAKQFKKTPPSNTPLVLWFSENLFPHVEKQGSKNGIYEVTCPTSGLTCLTTKDRNVLHDTTDRLMTVMNYGSDFRAYEAPIPRKKNHLWALLHEESPQNNQMLSHQQALAVFNFSATFKRTSDFPLTTQHIPNSEYFTSRMPVSMKEKNRYRKQGLAPIVYLQSHCDVPSDRDRYVFLLMQNISIDSYGSCLHNKDFEDLSLMDTSKMQDEALYSLLAKYKFHLAFENAVCDDYVSEKLFRPFHLGSVPVYLGSSTARDWSPRNSSVIMVSDFESPASLAEYLNYLDQNDEAYMAYLNYKSDRLIHNDLLRKVLEERAWSPDGYGTKSFVGAFECYVCEKMHKIQDEAKAGRDIPIYEVSNKQLHCPPPIPSFGSISDIPPTNHLHRWIEDYWQNLDQAVALNDMIRDNADDPERLWNYIEMRYNAGQGALQHSEL